MYLLATVQQEPVVFLVASRHAGSESSVSAANTNVIKGTTVAPATWMTERHGPYEDRRERTSGRRATDPHPHADYTDFRELRGEVQNLRKALARLVDVVQSLTARFRKRT